MSIHERKTQSGVRYDVKLRRPDGTAYQKTFHTKKEAKDFQNGELTDQRRGRWIDDRLSKITFAEYAQIWLDNNSNKRPRTRQRDEGVVSKHLLPELGKRAIRDIKHSDLRVLVNKWVKEGLSPGTIRRHKAVLSAIFRLAERDDVIHKSPTVGLETPKSEPSKGRALTPDESRRLLNAVDPAYAALIYVLLTTGIRWSELAGLEIRHFNSLAATPTLTIEQGLHETSHGLIKEKPKSAAGHRVIPLTNEQVLVISRQIESTGRTGAEPAAPLFVSPTGKQLRHTNFSPRIWVPATKMAGLEGLKLHDLRKTAITNLLQAGIDMKTVTVLVGHEDFRTTLAHYAKTTPQSLLAASESLVRALRLESHQDGLRDLKQKRK